MTDEERWCANRLYTRLALYGLAALLALSVVLRLLPPLPGMLDYALRAFWFGLVFLTIHEDQELGWGSKLWKGHWMVAGLFGAILAAYFLLPPGWPAGAGAAAALFVYFSVAVYAVARNLKNLHRYKPMMKLLRLQRARKRQGL